MRLEVLEILESPKWRYTAPNVSDTSIIFFQTIFCQELEMTLIVDHEMIVDRVGNILR